MNFHRALWNILTGRLTRIYIKQTRTDVDLWWDMWKQIMMPEIRNWTLLM